MLTVTESKHFECLAQRTRYTLIRELLFYLLTKFINIFNCVHVNRMTSSFLLVFLVIFFFLQFENVNM